MNRRKSSLLKKKPEQPKSNLCVPAFYLYKKESLPLVKTYLDEDNNPDAPRHLVPFLIKHKSVHAYMFEGKRYDIGTLDSYEKIKIEFNKKQQF